MGISNGIYFLCHFRSWFIYKSHQKILIILKSSKMSLKSSHTLTDQNYVNLVSWFHTWANTCLLYNTQWFNSNILIIIGPKIPISLHCNKRVQWGVELARRVVSQPMFDNRRFSTSLQNAVIWLVEISAAIWLVEIVYPHGYWTNHLCPLKNGCCCFEKLLRVAERWELFLRVSLDIIFWQISKF